MLLDSDPCSDQDYPIFGVIMTGPGDKNLCAPTIVSPIRTRYESLNLYVLAFASCVWHYYISSHLRLHTNECALSEEGQLVLLVEDMTEFPPIDKLMRAKVREEGAKK